MKGVAIEVRPDTRTVRMIDNELELSKCQDEDKGQSADVFIFLGSSCRHNAENAHSLLQNLLFHSGWVGQLATSLA